MKKLVFIIILLFIVSLFCAVYINKNDLILLHTLNSTDINENIYTEFKLGSDITSYDLNNYTLNPSFENKPYYFSNTYIDVTDNNIINRVQLCVYDKKPPILINDILVQFGENYKIKTYDRNQHLDSLVYVDTSNNTKLDVVFSSIYEKDFESEKVVFVIFSELK